MNRRHFIGLAAAAPFALPYAARAAGYSDAVFRKAIIIDGLGGVRDPYNANSNPRFSARAISELKESGLTACVTTVAEVGNDLNSWATTIERIAETDQIIVDNPDVLAKALSAADIRAAKAAGRTAIIYGTQDTALIGPALDRIGLLKGLGLRVIQLTYNNRNLSGDGCLEPGNAGVSKLGRATIARIEQEKLLLDLSHSGQRTVAEGIQAAIRPMAISHTGCRDLHDNPRNQYDAEMRACAQKGGVVGIYWMPFLVPNGKPTTADLIRHMDHAVGVCGEDHVSIGTDNMVHKRLIDERGRAAQKAFYESRAKAGIAAPGEGADIFNMVEELNSHLRFRMLADGLSKAGWSSARIDKVLGGNLMRLYGEVWGA